MRKLMIFIALCILTSTEVNAQTLSLMTYNLRYSSPNDGENVWENRKGFLAQQIQFYEPDVFGIQEGLIEQLTFLDSLLLKYEYVGVGRDNSQNQGEFSAVFYNTLKYQIIKHSTFWLSETPNKVSVGWDAALERICTYAHFKELGTNRKFWVFNTHFDHLGVEARIKSAKLILEKIEELAKNEEFVFLMGDFNLEPNSNVIQLIKSKFSDSQEVAELIFGNNGTYNAFKYNEKTSVRIDYIFTLKGSVIIQKYAILNNSYDLKFPSDHFPVWIEVLFK